MISARLIVALHGAALPLILTGWFPRGNRLDGVISDLVQNRPIGLVCIL
jgi:hypothetical protein